LAAWQRIVRRSREQDVQRLYLFFKSTIIGGLVVLVPLAALGYIAVRVIEIAYSAIAPVIAWLPIKSVAGVSLALFLSVAIVIAACFLAGLLAETAIVGGIVSRVERLVLSSVPGYALMKNVGESLIGVENKEGRKTVLIRWNASSQLGFLMDTLPDGQHVVFVPSAPNALVGALHIVSSDRVEVLSIPIPMAIDSIGRLGVGLRDSWPQMAESYPTQARPAPPPVS
jgi:uncharacterized membrane protein